MNTLGGFLLEPRPSSDGRQQYSESSSDATTRENHAAALRNGGTDNYNDEPVAIRKLSLKQEARLMDYLDEAFIKVNRAYQKRHNVATSSVPDVASFLKEYEAILVIIASIPPIGPSASLLVQFLLRYTDEVLDGIAGYEVGGLTGSDRQILNDELSAVITSLALLDRVWSSVLRGHMVDIPSAKANVDRKSKESENLFPTPSTSTSSIRAGRFSRYEREEGRRLNVKGKEEIGGGGGADHDHHLRLAAGRYPPTQTSSHEKKDSRSVIGSKGFSTVGQTHRIRLRNLITLGKEALFAWMRIQLDVPIPPKIDGNESDEKDDRKADKNNSEDTPRDTEAYSSATEGEIVVGVKEEEELDDEVKEGGGGEEDDEADLEEVDTSRPGKSDNQQQRGDPHFEELFARKIDPDASDSDDDDQTNIRLGKHSIDPNPTPQTSMKRRRRGPEEKEMTGSGMAASRSAVVSDDDDIDEEEKDDDESLATLSGTARVMTWDLRFARLFALTLRCLSDIQEYSGGGGNQREPTRDKGQSGLAEARS